MDYKNTNKTDETTIKKNDLEKIAQEIGKRMWKLTGQGEKAIALRLYSNQPPEIQSEVMRINPDAVRSAQLYGI